MLIFDGTIQEKAWTDESELMCWHFDHCSGRSVKGINLLNAIYHSKGARLKLLINASRSAYAELQQWQAAA